MKLKTKLIPLASLAVMSASVAPISLTSCNTNPYIGRSFNVCKPFYPTIEKHAHGSFDRYTIHHDYVKQLKKDLTTFVQDFMWSEAAVGDAFEQYLFWVKLLEPINPPNAESNARNPIEVRDVMGIPTDYYDYNNFVISDLQMRIQTVDWLDGGLTWDIPRLSFTLNFNSRINDVTFQFLVGDDILTGYANGLCNGTIVFYDVPFIITDKIAFNRPLGFGVKVISFEPFALWMCPSYFDGALPPVDDIGYWSIKTNIVSTLSGEIFYETGVSQKIADDWILNRDADNSPGNQNWIIGDLGLYKTLTSLFLTSYYLQEVTMK